jgi:hypothetical protein
MKPYSRFLLIILIGSSSIARSSLLAADEGMRILAASKSGQSAVELGKNRQGETIDEGLLSYALVHEGLEEGKAAKDGR